VNSTESPKEITNKLGLEGPTSYCVDATGISLKILESSRGFNTVMLGALIESTKIISMKSAQEAVRSRFAGKLLEKNLKLLETGSKEVITA
jgi:Pyruvate/2-oxoacid:ferredoxin oxidoreductase gamma subunit